jgi:hypothetical protein
MKNIIFIALALLTVSFGCSNKKEVEPEIEFNSADAKIVASREGTLIPAAGRELSVSLKEIADSRCPSNVVCITMGAAQLTLAVQDGTNSVLVKTSFDGDGRRAAQEKFELSGQSYAIKVTEVSPYPQTTKSPALEEYKISVMIVKI